MSMLSALALPHNAPKLADRISQILGLPSQMWAFNADSIGHAIIALNGNAGHCELMVQDN